MVEPTKQTPSLESLVAQAFNEDWDDETLTGMWEMLGRPGLTHSSTTNADIQTAIRLLHRLREQLEIRYNGPTFHCFIIDYKPEEQKYYVQPEEKYKYV